MRVSRIKAKLRRDEPALIMTLHMTDASVYEMTSLLGYDGIWMDLEHHGYSVETACQLMRAARVGTADRIRCKALRQHQGTTEIASKRKFKLLSLRAVGQ